MTENYTPPAVWQRWADEGGEATKMATEYEHGFADGRVAQAQEMKRLQATIAHLKTETLRLIDTNRQYMDIMAEQAEVRDRVFAVYQESQKTIVTLLSERDELAAKLAAIGQRASVTEVTP